MNGITPKFYWNSLGSCKIIEEQDERCAFGLGTKPHTLRQKIGRLQIKWRTAMIRKLREGHMRAKELERWRRPRRMPRRTRLNHWNGLDGRVPRHVSQQEMKEAWHS